MDPEMPARGNAAPGNDAFLGCLHRALEGQLALYRDTDVHPKDIDGMSGPHLHKNWEVKFAFADGGGQRHKVFLTPPGAVHKSVRRDFSMEVGGRSVLYSTSRRHLFQTRTLSAEAVRLNVVPDLLRAAVLMVEDDRRLDIGRELVRSALRLILHLLELSPGATGANNVRSVVPDAMEYMQTQYYQANLRISDVAKAVGVTEQHLNRLFRRETEKTLRQTLIEIRLVHARELLRSRKYLVKTVANLTGWQSPFYFCNCYRRHFGVPPRDDAH